MPSPYRHCPLKRQVMKGEKKTSSEKLALQSLRTRWRSRIVQHGMRMQISEFLVSIKVLCLPRCAAFWLFLDSIEIEKAI
ncbi:hypothetical protein CEXT_144551 [Caerostris extrusa]|uniref:Uncharacterized protein n=1 Tax=Caerostris extrusa TaxID=172846 RepID=A0AAV4Y8Z9_CAEEX|nr:hypothetical protein CEXT_144551 [Caerostris extrusa]